jgi:ectoine hydroxylase-related dioxygenase (phytanoyl-CoA dioxygenase family)
VELGLVSEAEAERVCFFIDNGYVVLPGAVSPERVARLRADLDRLAVEPVPEAWVECRDDDPAYRVVRPMRKGDHEALDRGTRILDTHSFLPSARDVVFAPATLRFLHLVFERPALAHQSLLFYRGSQQEVHQDSPFVRVSSPRELAASWTALEDVRPGSGELVYHPRSHRVAEYRFEGKYKWLTPGCGEGDSFHQHLTSEVSGLPQERLLARKGDVLIWHADLAHGGARIDDRSSSRLSLVAHYCPLGTWPMYREYTGGSEPVRVGPGAYSCAPNKSLWRSG